MAVWTCEIREIRKPSLDHIEVSFRVTKDGAEYSTEQIALRTAELSGLSDEEQRAVIQERMTQRLRVLEDTDAVHAELQDMVGDQFEVML